MSPMLSVTVWRLLVLRRSSGQRSRWWLGGGSRALAGEARDGRAAATSTDAPGSPADPVESSSDRSAASAGQLGRCRGGPRRGGRRRSPAATSAWRSRKATVAAGSTSDHRPVAPRRGPSGRPARRRRSARRGAARPWRGDVGRRGPAGDRRRASSRSSSPRAGAPSATARTTSCSSSAQRYGSRGCPCHRMGEAVDGDPVARLASGAAQELPGRARCRRRARRSSSAEGEPARPRAPARASRRSQRRRGSRPAVAAGSRPEPPARPRRGAASARRSVGRCPARRRRWPARYSGPRARRSPRRARPRTRPGRRRGRPRPRAEASALRLALGDDGDGSRGHRAGRGLAVAPVRLGLRGGAHRRPRSRACRSSAAASMTGSTAPATRTRYP